MAEASIEVLPIATGAIPDPNNINKHTLKGSRLLENSLRRRGAFRSIASAGKNVDTPVVMAGNLTLAKAISAGFTEIINVHVTGNQIVNVVRDDLEPSSVEAIALALEDNEIGKQSYAPDYDMLAVLEASDNGILAQLKVTDGLFGTMLNDMRPYQPDIEELWQGMPQFANEDLIGDAYKTLTVRFETQDDYRVFASLIEQPLTPKTKAIWYPAKDFDSHNRDNTYRSEQ